MGKISYAVKYNNVIKFVLLNPTFVTSFMASAACRFSLTVCRKTVKNLNILFSKWQQYNLTTLSTWKQNQMKRAGKI